MRKYLSVSKDSFLNDLVWKEKEKKMARTPRLKLEDDYEDEQRKQAAADVLYQYSQFVMVCIGEGVRPTDLRLHLMKEISGMATSLKKEALPSPSFSDFVGEPSSSRTERCEKCKSP